MTDSDRADTVTAREWFCPTCGDEIDAHEECESWPCANCGAEMEPLTRKVEYVPIGVLEDLVEEMEETESMIPANEASHLLKYRNRLQEAIDDYGDTGD